MVDRTRKMVRYPAEEVDIKYSTLGSALQTIQRLIEKYGENADIDMHSYAYSDTEYFYVFTDRPETDEEMQTRIRQEEIWAKNREEQDIKEFERLKKKFKSK